MVSSAASSILSNRTASTERLDVVDALRGFALFGVVVANVVGASGFNPFANPALVAAPADAATFEWLLIALIDGKFMAQFSLLFGLGFGLMLERSRARGVPFVSTYLRRLGGLFLIGFAETLLFGSNVLLTYAVLALVLLALHRAPTRWLLVVLVAAVFLPVATQPARAWLLQSLPSARGLWPRELELHQTRDVIGYVQHQVAFLWPRIWPVFLGNQLLALFVGGLLVARSQVLSRLEESGVVLRRALGCAIVAFALMTALAFALRSNPALVSGWARRWVMATLVLRGWALAAIYVTGILLLWRRGGVARRALGALAPAGRLALTGYFVAPIAGFLLFDLTGTYNRVGALTGAVIGVTVYLALMGTAHWWFRDFRHGPIEWVWRSITYGRVQFARFVAVTRGALAPGRA